MILERDVESRIRAVLSAPSPDAEERAEWAREALARAATAPPARSTRLRFAVPLAAAAAVIVLWFALRGPPAGPAAPAPPPTPADIAKAREADEAALSSAEVKARLAAAPAGSFAAIAMGRLVALGTDENALAEELEWAAPAAAHAFFFPVGREGDVTAETTFDYETVAGCAFLAATDLSMGGGPNGWTFYREDSPGKEKAEFPSPDGRPFLPVRIWAGEGERIVFLVATGFGGPLILPDGLTFPRAEIPGRATVKGMSERAYRRYFLRVRVPELAIDRRVEAFGDLLTPLPEWKLAGIEWPKASPERVAAARAAGKRLLLLTWSAGEMLPLGPFDEWEGASRFAGVVTARHTTPWMPAPGLPSPEGGFSSPELVLYDVTATGATFAARLSFRADVTPEALAAFLKE